MSTTSCCRGMMGAVMLGSPYGFGRGGFPKNVNMWKCQLISWFVVWKCSFSMQIIKLVSTDQTTKTLYWLDKKINKVHLCLFVFKCPQLQAMPTRHSCLEMAVCQSGSPEQGWASSLGNGDQNYMWKPTDHFVIRIHTFCSNVQNSHHW